MNSGAMSSNFELNPEFYDVGWDAQLEPEDRDGLQLSQVQDRSDWIVKLQFTQGKDTSYGTGFYVNIPDTKTYVVLTAGHNLINAEGISSRNLVVFRAAGSASSATQNNLKINDQDIFISSSYRVTPSNANTENDYGAILVPRAIDNARARGFGFALKLGHDDLRKDELSISGYRVDTAPGLPVTSTGQCIGCQENQLEYRIQTEKGLSGSPVIMAYKGHDTAVAIHNHGPAKRGRGSRGTRLNEKVLDEIFSWINVGQRNRLLRVFPSKGVPDEGLYLRFRPDESHGWVRLGREGLETSFDILPAYAPPPTVASSPLPLYVFRFRFPPGWPRSTEERWVLWDFMKKRVTLTSALQEPCFPRIVQDSKAKDAFHIVLAATQGTMGELFEFRMQAADLTAADIEMEEFDTPEASFVKYVRNKKVKFNNFSFE
ncbi:hypothetical protein F5Y14DRAFT_217796 [Nemania sp. NC0429]|nr:hypothetical protein F5Y14DRAFT_217796 [Nemania sp. NC0429]